MATFTNFNDRLPDPTFGQGDAGEVNASGTFGPGFASVQVSSIQPVDVSRTNSGRGVHRTFGSHQWNINIRYNPMRREQFDVVTSFLESRGGRMYPFFVVLPQHSKPKDAAFAIFATNNVISLVGNHTAGDSTLLMDATPNFTSYPRPGDFFRIADPANVNHTKVYKVVRVETNANYQTASGQPAANQIRVHCNPPLTRFTLDNAVINWINPQFRVMQKSEVIEYELNTDNLYQYQLDLEEIQP